MHYENPGGALDLITLFKSHDSAWKSANKRAKNDPADGRFCSERKPKDDCIVGFLLVNTKPNTFFKELGDIQFPLLKSQQ